MRTHVTGTARHGAADLCPPRTGRGAPRWAVITGPLLSLALCPLPANTGSRPPEKFTWVAGREAVRAAKEWHAGADLPALRQGTQGPATRYSLGEARASRGRQRLARAGGRRPAAHAHAAHGQGATPGSHREQGQPCALLGPVSAGVRLWGTPRAQRAPSTGTTAMRPGGGSLIRPSCAS